MVTFNHRSESYNRVEASDVNYEPIQVSRASCYASLSASHYTLSSVLEGRIVSVAPVQLIANEVPDV
jgi:hypothetical protein